ncbi:hypothetical protein BGX23_003512, partial [Mortierella sp. AD031]
MPSFTQENLAAVLAENNKYLEIAAHPQMATKMIRVEQYDVEREMSIGRSITAPERVRRSVQRMKLNGIPVTT